MSKCRENGCNSVAIGDEGFCKYHGNNRNSMYRFNVQRYAQRVGQLKDATTLKSLREEVAVLRMLLEEKFNSIGDDQNALMLQSNSIADLILKIEKVVLSCNAIEFKLGIMIDKSTLLTMVDQIIQIITKEVDDPLKLDSIANQIADVINKDVPAPINKDGGAVGSATV